ncbi:DUF6456 domain-containing protein [Sinisalibacter lacisalsi]|uniref:Helix-turn-helix domain containing protein n=1 Tax=Sinisalibacter lacisalsi TaxID=1526570 RepID=A0ABQ1QKW1_9RHOB|nr:DUF6456 domain-containing protein [Sinisalibacter lacisalsi]GGD31720.1 helix-turn-helix domain containing protein [Sinisalibacter lacisalsi]
MANATRALRWDGLPNWLPRPVRLYLAHTEGGESIRALARAAGCHPSTVLRQVRRTETLRDDPLTDTALARLGRQWRTWAGAVSRPFPAQDHSPMPEFDPIDDETLARDMLRALKALLEPRTLMVIAQGVEDAVVVHNAGGDRPVRRAVVGRPVAEALVLRELIAGEPSGRIARYTITAAGRAEAIRRIAEAESRRAAGTGLAEDADAAPVPRPQARRRAEPRKRAVGADAPLHVLARRRRTDGSAFLPPELIAAALKFRESYELARIGGGLTRDWGRLVSGRTASGRVVNGAGPTRRLEAEQSLAAAIRALGPDLAESVLLAVCHERGMEEIEDQLDFPARSGKIVLRIALRTLHRHYAEHGSGDDDLIY